MLLIMDDSGSMSRQFTPDFASSNSNAGTVANCFNSRDLNNPPTTSPQDCYAGDPPAMSPDFNTQYYNPQIRYFPALNYDGTTKGEMNATATTKRAAHEIRAWSAYLETMPVGDAEDLEWFAAQAKRLNPARTDLQTIMDYLDADDHASYGGLV